MRSLVTGASGFVGRHLVDHLTAHGHEVIGLDRRHLGIDVTDASALNAAFLGHRPEVVYHLAGDSDVGGSWSHPRSTFEANAVGTMQVLEAARSAGVRRVLCVGSADVYGRVRAEDLPLTESAPLQPVSPYAASKVAADYLAVQAALGYGQDVVRARPFNHLGPGQTERFVAPALAMRIARNETAGDGVVPVGNLTPRRDFTDVRDVVEAYRLLMEFGAAGEVYNVCSGKAIAVQQLAEQMLSMATIPMILAPEQDLQRPVDIPLLLGDNTRLRRATGWAPQIPLSDTLADLLNDCRSRVSSET